MVNAWLASNVGSGMVDFAEGWRKAFEKDFMSMKRIVVALVVVLLGINLAVAARIYSESSAKQDKDNSFAQMGHHFLGASSTGLYQLDGPLDVGSAIVATVKSGSAQFSGSRYTAFDAVYLGCRVSDGANDWLLKLHTGDGQCYVYQFQPLNRRTTKIFVGKGLRARYFSWELVTAGENFDLDSIEFVPISSKRRV